VAVAEHAIRQHVVGGAVLRDIRTMMIFAAATGLRPSELFGLECRDVERDADIVHVRHAYANRRLKHRRRGSARVRCCEW
jgi:integrase